MAPAPQGGDVEIGSAAATWGNLVSIILETIVALGQRGLPPVFAYVYDPAWALLQQVGGNDV